MATNRLNNIKLNNIKLTNIKLNNIRIQTMSTELYTAVVFTPRTGSSLTIDGCRLLCGDDAIHGDQFPQEAQETSNPAEAYSKSKISQRYKDMNPNGFFEDGRIVGKGLSYSTKRADMIEEVLCSTASIIKLTGVALSQTPPAYIGKVIVVVRNPYDTARSQAKLIRDRFSESEKPKTPKVNRYIRDYVAISRWLLANPSIPSQVVEFEQHMADPDEVMRKLSTFLGVASVDSPADPSLSNGTAEVIEGEEWDLASSIHEAMCAGDWQGVLDLSEDPVNVLNRNKRFRCFRLNRDVNSEECRTCKSNLTVRNQYKKTAEALKIDYATEPCMFDIGMDPTREVITVEESIANNHWLT